MNKALGNSDRNTRALVVLRVAVAIFLGIHDFYRAFTHGVAGFGQYLADSGWPAGRAVAWAITLVGMVASLALLAGRGVRLAAAWYCAVLCSGIAMVHAREGWFVVGDGRNGVEYSALLIACLVVLFMSAPAAKRRHNAGTG